MKTDMIANAIRVAIDSFPHYQLSLLDFLPAVVASILGALVAVVGTLVVQKRLLRIQEEEAQQAAEKRNRFEQELQERFLDELRQHHEASIRLQTELQKELLERQLKNNLLMSRWVQENERYHRELGHNEAPRLPPSLDRLRELIEEDDFLRRNEERARSWDRVSETGRGTGDRVSRRYNLLSQKTKRSV